MASVGRNHIFGPDDLVVFLLGDETDWDHVFKSRFDRLLLQWVGVGWILIGPSFGAWFSFATLPSEPKS